MMRENPACGGVISRTAKSMQAKDIRELSGVFFTAVEQKASVPR